MADNNLQASFRKLMRYAQNLAEYNKAIEDGIIDENVFVIVLDEKVAKFKGQTFDWSGGISQSTADERYIRKTVDEFDSPLTFAVADGIVGTDDEYYFLPEKAPSTALDSQILATKADIPEIDTSTLATKEELTNLINEVIDDEEVLAHSLNELNERVLNIAEELTGDFASKEEFDSALESLSQVDTTNQQAISEVSGKVTTLTERVDNIPAEFADDFATKEALETSNSNLTNEVIDDEEVLAHAINDLNARLEALTARIATLESNNA